MQNEKFLRMAIDLARENGSHGARPFGAVLVKDGKVLATGVNQIMSTNDPTAHAELSAIREASQKLGSPRLEGCTVYASGQPCPMCLAAIHLTGIREVIFAYSNNDAQPFGLSSAAVYTQMALPLDQQSISISQMPMGEPDIYREWQSRTTS